MGEVVIAAQTFQLSDREATRYFQRAANDQNEVVLFMRPLLQALGFMRTVSPVERQEVRQINHAKQFTPQADKAAEPRLRKWDFGHSRPADDLTRVLQRKEEVLMRRTAR